MAELLLKVDDGSEYADGDCLCAFSDRHIKCVHAESICHPRRAQRTNSGMLLKGSLAWHWARATSQYRFERLSKTEVMRIEQGTGVRERFGPESIDVRQFIRRRKRNPNHQLFTDGDTVIWFGGRSDFSGQRVDAVWREISRVTPWSLSRERFNLWPMGRLDIRHHLAIRTDAITDRQVQDFTEPLYRTNDNGEFAWRLDNEIQHTDSIRTEPDDRQGWEPIIAKKRRRRIAWRDLLSDLGEVESRIRDRSQAVGHEIDDGDGVRYTSKAQTLQQLTRIRKKGAITR